MNLLQVKEIVLQECKREKRIVVRNFILVAILVLVVMALVLTYLLPQLTQFANDAVAEVNKNKNFSGYYKIVIPLAIALSIFYPLRSLLRVLKREKKAEEAFALMETGPEVIIYTEEETYLTTIPLLKIRLKTDPVTHLFISIGDKSYTLPVVPQLLPDIKRVLSNANIDAYQSIMREIYGDNDHEVQEQPPTQLKPVKEFSLFADKEFSKEMEMMEKGRSKNKNMLYLQFLFAFAFLGAIIWVSSRPNALKDTNSIFMLIGGFVGVSTVMSYGFYYYAKKNNTGTISYTEFKKSIFSRLVQYINPKFEYIEKAHIGLPELLHSELFIEEDYQIQGGDQIVGRYNKVPFQSCNLAVSYRKKIRNENEADDVVFYGNFFVARFPKKIKHPVFLHPKKSFWGNIKDNDISSYLNEKGEKIRLEDPEFQKQFTVYCDDQITARYVLTPAFMERIKTLNTRNKGNMYVSINENNIVIATNQASATNTGDGIYGMMFTKIDMQLVNGIYLELIEQLEMIDTLKLNNQIWKN